MDDAQTEQLDGRLLTDTADSFYGYGTYKASYWFVGMGEGGGGLVAQINARLEAWRLRGHREVEDLRSFHEAFGMVKFFQSPAVLGCRVAVEQPTGLSSLLVRRPPLACALGCFHPLLPACAVVTTRYGDATPCPASREGRCGRLFPLSHWRRE